jgi:hypothetical protein
MPKGVKVKKTLTVKESVEQKPIEDYVDYTSALIRYGLLMYYKTKGDIKELTGEVDKTFDIYKEPIDLSSTQVQYLNMRMDNISTSKACDSLKIERAAPMLWEVEKGAKSVYGFCLEALKRLQAVDLEDQLWEKSIDDPSFCKGNVAMFNLKSRMPEYRENAVNTGNNVVQVNLTVGDKSYTPDTSIDYEIISDEDNPNG